MLCALLPLGPATGAVLMAQSRFRPDSGLLVGALLLLGLGCAMVLVHRHTQALMQPLQQATLALEALQRGDYDHPVPVRCLDQTGEVLMRIRALGDYLAVMLPAEDMDLEAAPEVPSAQKARLPQTLPRHDSLAFQTRATQARDVVSALSASAGQSRM
ncbi:MAG: hypothetical protein RLZZ592_2304 [Pseudomonadota bacterium]|jgi:hypothetical protein